MITFRLQQIAEQREMNRHQLSMQTGVSYPTISKYWDGEIKMLDLGILDKLCRLLKCTPGDLLHLFADDPNGPPSAD